MTPEEKAKLHDLFERAAKDYVSVDVWLEYCQFSISGSSTPDGLDLARYFKCKTYLISIIAHVHFRSVFEKALSSVGIHVAKGSIIWETYREFEMAMASLATTDEDKKSQRDRIDKIFKRQLTVPLLDMDQTLEEYKAWLGQAPDKSVEAAFSKTMTMLKAREQFEVELLR